MRAPVTLLILSLTGPLVAGAQAQARRGLCFQPAGYDRCRASWITEFGGSLGLASTEADSRRSLFQWNLGAIKNVSPRLGVGGAGFFTWSESAVTVGVAPRLRYFVSRSVSLDAAPGLIVFQGGSRNIGFNGQLAANLGSHVSLTTTLQVTRSGRFAGSRPLQTVEWFAGARLNGAAGAISGIAAPILTFLTYLALFSAFSD